MLSRVETSFYKPLGTSLRHLLRQFVRDLYKALLIVQPACTFYNMFTYASAPKWDGCEHVLSNSRRMWSKCRLRIDSYPPALQTWEVGVLWSPLLPHKSCLVLALALSITFATDSLLASVTLTKQQQFHTVCKFSLALAQYIILTKNYPTNERNLKGKFTVWALSFELF